LVSSAFSFAFGAIASIIGFQSATVYSDGAGKPWHFPHLKLYKSSPFLRTSELEAIAGASGVAGVCGETGVDGEVCVLQEYTIAPTNAKLYKYFFIIFDLIKFKNK
jgi:hypothetical protein